MKLSPSVIKNLRAQHGWSQEQLAIASGVSLRTIQRVEAEGVASTSTAVCLAATFSVNLIELQSAQNAMTLQTSKIMYGLFFLGAVLITLALISESGRLPGPQANAFLSINIFTALVAALILIPTCLNIFKSGRFIGAILITFGAPLVTLSLCGLVNTLVSGNSVNLPVVIFGVAGVSLTFIATKELWRKEQKSSC